MRRIILNAIVWISTFWIATGPALGQDLNLWPAGALGAKGTAAKDIPTLKVYPAPKEVSVPVPAILLIPGGGYKHISGERGQSYKF